MEPAFVAVADSPSAGLGGPHVGYPRQLQLVGRAFTAEPYGIGVRKGDTRSGIG